MGSLPNSVENKAQKEFDKQRAVERAEKLIAQVLDLGKKLLPGGELLISALLRIGVPEQPEQYLERPLQPALPAQR